MITLTGAWAATMYLVDSSCSAIMASPAMRASVSPISCGSWESEIVPNEAIWPRVAWVGVGRAATLTGLDTQEGGPRWEEYSRSMLNALHRQLGLLPQTRSGHR